MDPSASPGNAPALPDVRVAYQTHPSAAWYAVRVRNGTESAVAQAFRDRHIREFCPARQTTVVWSDRVKSVDAPLFPCYLFAHIRRRLDQHGVLAVRGVLQILGTENDSISDDAIETLRRIVRSPAVVAPLAYVQAGATCRVKNGPFADCIGVVVRLKGAVRLVVSIPMLGQSVSVELDYADVKAEAV